MRGDYRWSNYRATAGLAPAPCWLEIDWTLGQFSPGGRAKSCEAYRRFVSEGRAAEYKPWESLIGQIYLGSEEFCERMQQLVSSKPRSRQHPKAQRVFVRPAFEAVIDQISRTFDEPVEQLRERSHRASRKALAQLAWQESGLTLAAKGNWMNITDRAASHLVKCGKALEKSDRLYGDRVRRMRDELQPKPMI